MIIEKFEVPQSLATSEGITGNTISHLYYDNINVVNNVAKSVIKRKSFDAYNEELNIDVPFLNKEISVGTASKFMHEIFGIGPGKISGEIIIVKGDIIKIISRYNGINPVIVEGSIEKMDSLILKSVEGQFKYFDPFLLASYYDESDDYKSVEIIKYILKTRPLTDDKWAYNLWGKILMDHYFYADAKKKFEEAIKIDPKFSLPYYNLGQLALHDGDFLKAKNYFDKSLKFTRDLIQAINGIGKIY